jgi:glutathione S-transferase
MTAVLWQLELSHYSEKVRWALDYKAIPHERRTPLPGLHGLRALVLTRGAQRRLPVLELDGRRIGDSTVIIAALERHRPDPPLYPEDRGERARALELEDYFDESLAPSVRGWVFHQTLDDTDTVIDMVMPNAGRRRKRAMRALAPIARPAVRADYKIDAERADRALVDIRAAMDRLEAELQPSGYLVGDAFSVADLTAASLFTPVLMPPGRQYPPRAVAPAVRELRTELEARDGGRWVGEMFARHRGVSAEVAHGRAAASGRGSAGYTRLPGP